MDDITLPKIYVVVGLFPNGDWFLKDAMTLSNVVMRKWTNNPRYAIGFLSEDDAETIGSLVLEEDKFLIEAIKNPFQ